MKRLLMLTTAYARVRANLIWVEKWMLGSVPIKPGKFSAAVKWLIANMDRAETYSINRGSRDAVEITTHSGFGPGPFRLYVPIPLEILGLGKAVARAG